MVKTYHSNIAHRLRPLVASEFVIKCILSAMETDHYYIEIAVAFVRGKLGEMPALSSDEIIRAGLEAGLRLHKFKRNSSLPRVRKVLGLLRGLAPRSLIDIGSGRGTFL